MTADEQTNWQRLQDRVAELEAFAEQMKRLEIQINGSNGAIVFTRDNAVIRIGTQT